MKIILLIFISILHAQPTVENIQKKLQNKSYRIHKMYRSGKRVEIPTCKKSYYFTLKKDGSGKNHYAKGCAQKHKEKTKWKIIKQDHHFYITNGVDQERIDRYSSKGFTISYPDPKGRIKLDFIAIKK